MFYNVMEHQHWCSAWDCKHPVAFTVVMLVTFSTTLWLKLSWTSNVWVLCTVQCLFIWGMDYLGKVTSSSHVKGQSRAQSVCNLHCLWPEGRPEWWWIQVHNLWPNLCVHPKALWLTQNTVCAQTARKFSLCAHKQKLSNFWYMKLISCKVWAIH